MTVVYKDYYTAYENGDFDINDVSFDCRLVTDAYEPKETDKPDAIKQYILSSYEALKGDIMTTKGMGEIMQVLQEKMEQDIINDKDDVLRYAFALLGKTKGETIKQLIEQLEQNPEFKFEFWRGMKENGVKWLVVESRSLNILCFCEEVM
jgi:hypothetical protein